MMLLAAADFPNDGPSRTYYEFARLQSMTQWWHWMLLTVVCLAIAGWVVSVYRRDTAELPRGIRILLLVMRLTALAGLLLFFLQPEKRTERKLTKASRVALLVDTSQSMGLADSEQTDQPGQTRLAEVIEAFSQGELFDTLRNKHEITVYRFDQERSPAPLATLAQRAATDPVATKASVVDLSGWQIAKWLYRLAVGLLGFAGLAVLLHLVSSGWGRGREGESWFLLAGGLALVVAIVLAAVANLRQPSRSPMEAFRAEQPVQTPVAVESTSASSAPTDGDADLDWSQQLAARGAETRLGDALRWIVDREQGGPLAGIVAITDGRNNSGLDPIEMIAPAAEAQIPLFAVGLGSDRSPQNVRVVDVEAPPRVYPDDNFTITGYLQASGFAGRTVRVQLISTSDSPDAPETVQEERRVPLSEDGQIQPIRFTVAPEAIGRRRWTVRVAAPAEDLEPADNQRAARVEVVERKNRVLLLAGGPLREYRFLRNLLFRDPNTTLHVVLQSAPPGAAQEADEVLRQFPQDAETLFEYDCLVAFDPDWRQLTSEQTELLDRWVAEKAGGLILVAGPVFTPNWSRGGNGADETKLNRIRSLYPVTFYRRGSANIRLGRVNSETVWPLEFTSEARQAPFLWLEDASTTSEAAWARFPGIYGYQAVKDIKPGAKVYARFSDPQATMTDEAPVYMAGQFYGAGRVFYLGSGEMWRLRGVESSYFDTFYTKLIREVSQGRLLRDSTRGILLLERERCSLGESITIRATLSDTQYRPLTLPTVTANVIHERGSRSTLTLRQITNAEREGMYAGQFTPLREGDYRIELAIPGIDGEILSRDLRVRIPAVEIEQPQRNDALLTQLTQRTNGAYFVGLDAALGRDGIAPLAGQIRAKDQETYLPGSPDRDFALRLHGWLLAGICGALSLEWLVRRLSRLA